MARDFDVSIPRMVLAALVVSVLVVAVLAGSSSSAALSPYNADWDGASDLRSMASERGEVVVARGTGAYDSVSPRGTVAFVLSPDSEYSSSELLEVSRFVRNGGTLVVAGDFGPHTNELLRVLGTKARLDGRPLRDPRSNYRTPAMPVASRVPNASLSPGSAGGPGAPGRAPIRGTTGADSVTLNYGTAVEPNGATVVYNTSGYAYLDTDRNGKLGSTENLTSAPVVTAERLGAGRVVVVSDSSVFIDAMVEEGRNRAFVASLLSGHDRVLLDYSHTAGLPPLVVALLVVRDSAWLTLAAGAAAVGVLGVWSRRPDLLASAKVAFPRPWRHDSDLDGAPDSGVGVRPTRGEVAAHLERRHPEWDRERVERVAAALHRRRDG
ncbi:DUF4350 domain-containing protein (plasmid) [Halorussus limi]|uniref:DUF4350 domain-containing protein n=1 Tax=Halorussus limi TaxID=2938695 RepID=A0A8U0I0U8_9EURY|nr:DUF4350 domain-containing protein [Halorussus limi]UPV76653.1 DUF4350 domain-containing protein [Halorussus limi]